VLNHPSVVWRQFRSSEDGKQAFKDRGIVPAKPRARKPTADLKRDLDQANARIEELEEELEAAQFLGPVTETTAAPPRLTEADVQAYQQERSMRAEIDWVRGAYVALFPVDPEARRAELETLRRELHLDDPESTKPAAMRPRTNKVDLLSLLEYIAEQSAEAEKNTDPLPATKPIALKWKSATPNLELSFAFRRTTLQ